MALKFNDIEVSSLMFNGQEQMSLNFNGEGFFGKRFSLTKNSSTGVSFSLRRNKSPNQRAVTGEITTGNTIYYGDEITITITISSGYTSPILYVNIGDGNGFKQRTSPFTFTVEEDVTFYGTATESNTWQTVWQGANTFTDSGSFTVQGLQSWKDVQISAEVDFSLFYIDEDESCYPEEPYSVNINRNKLPLTIQGNTASIDMFVNGNQILFTFNIGREDAKGFYIFEVPTSLTITEVRGKA